MGGQDAVVFDDDSDCLADEAAAFQGLFEVVKFGGGFAEEAEPIDSAGEGLGEEVGNDHLVGTDPARLGELDPCPCSGGGRARGERDARTWVLGVGVWLAGKANPGGGSKFFGGGLPAIPEVELLAQVELIPGEEATSSAPKIVLGSEPPAGLLHATRHRRTGRDLIRAWRGPVDGPISGSVVRSRPPTVLRLRGSMLTTANTALQHRPGRFAAVFSAVQMPV